MPTGRALINKRLGFPQATGTQETAQIEDPRWVGQFANIYVT